MVKLKVNGTERSFDGDSTMPLLWYLRDELRLTGTKFGCGMALCGACTVHKDGKAVRACMTPMSAVVGAEITTIEGLGANGLHPVQKAWMHINVPQCGYCQPGQMMQAASLLKTTRNPPTRILTPPCPEIFAAAEPTSACGPRSNPRRRNWHERDPERKQAWVSERCRLRRECLCCACVSFLTSLHAEGLPGNADVDHAAFHPSMYVGIDTDGTVYIIAHRSEMGTTSRTSVPMILADELDADWKRVKLEQAIGDERYGSQNTDGSHSIREFYEPMRQAGATARMMLTQAAANQWGVPVSECAADLHTIVHSTTKRRLGYGELATAAAKLPVPKTTELKFKPKSAWRYIGKGSPSYDLSDVVTGKAVYGMDARMDGHGVRVDPAAPGSGRKSEIV